MPAFRMSFALSAALENFPTAAAQVRRTGVIGGGVGFAVCEAGRLGVKIGRHPWCMIASIPDPQSMDTCTYCIFIWFVCKKLQYVCKQHSATLGLQNQLNLMVMKMTLIEERARRRGIVTDRQGGWCNQKKCSSNQQAYM